MTASHTPSEDPRIVAIARVAHEANREYCATLGDYTQPLWAFAPEWQRQSAIAGVKFHIETPGAPPSASHESWLKEKVLGGWTWGPIKDALSKKHPCIVPFGELPAAQQRKDVLFSAVVRALA